MADRVRQQVRDDLADPDGDGLVNLAEYALGSDPKLADTSLRPAAGLQTINGQTFLTLTFRRLLLAEEVAYIVEISEDLVHWRTAAQLVGNPVLNIDGTQTVTYRDDIPVSSTGYSFLRLSVQRQPF